MGESIRSKQLVVISAINFFEGGPLSILNECLTFCNEHLYREYHVLALVHDANLFTKYANVEFLEFKKSRKNYLYRLYYEYYYFKQLSKKIDPFLWISLHDITPNVKACKRVVYCHNPSPFRKVNLKDLLIQPKLFLFSLFYKYLYKINIHKNNYVIVQQQWIREYFNLCFHVPLDTIIVSRPITASVNKDEKIGEVEMKEDDFLYRFFFPTFPRPFKNIEVIAEAVKILSQRNIFNFQVIITIDGKENKYSSMIFKQYENLKNILFVGTISRNEVFDYYKYIDCLIFPSKLETWGLPISEFKTFGKPMLVANLPYAKETVGAYSKVIFFNPDSAFELADYMEKFISSPLYSKFDITSEINYSQPLATGWADLFKLLTS